MTTMIFQKVGPLVSIQDNGRFGALGHGTAASGPMDRSSYHRAGRIIEQNGSKAASTALESAGGLLQFTLTGGSSVAAAFCGGQFNLRINGSAKKWDEMHLLADGDTVEIAPGPKGNYALVRMDHEFDVPPIINSRSTNTIAHLGGFKGRLIRAEDEIPLKKAVSGPGPLPTRSIFVHDEGPIRFIWGMHAELFSAHIRNEFISNSFEISPMLNRMGVRLTDRSRVFRDKLDLSLVSDAIVPGDVQILGDGSPIVLMRDHQPTGGYPRIASIISADLDRFAQLRPGSRVDFRPVTTEHAHRLLKQAG